MKLPIARVNGHSTEGQYMAVRDNEGLKYLVPVDKYNDWLQWRGSNLADGDNPKTWELPKWAKMCIVFSGTKRKNKHERNKR